MLSKVMLESLLKKQLMHVPRPQSHFAFLRDSWHQVLAERATPHPDPQHEYTFFKQLKVITWNIDFMTPFPRHRMAAALDHLEDVVSRIPDSIAVCIFLQEMAERKSLPEWSGYDEKSSSISDQYATDLTQICKSPWVQQRFHVTDMDDSKWNNDYGTVTLIDRRLHVANVARYPFVSEYHRDALLVDILVGNPSTDNILRLCNVHLDSMDGALRPVQWKGAAAQLQTSSEGIVASILAGDCNANRPRDYDEPEDNGFKDAYLELGGTEADAEGLTWGFQSTNWKRWGRQRLDKVVFWGDVELNSLERIGVGVRVNDEIISKELEKQEELDFATDHYGLMADIKIPGGLLAVQKNEEGGHGKLEMQFRGLS